MNRGSSGFLQVDAEGRLVIPASLVQRFGLHPGSRVYFVEDGSEVHFTRPVSHLARVYVEPTNICNLDCRTCMRNVWDEPLGRMEMDTFARVLAGLRDFSPCPTLFFGGFGEPLAHPQLLEMMRMARAQGVPLEMITKVIWMITCAVRAPIRSVMLTSSRFSRCGTPRPIWRCVSVYRSLIFRPVSIAIRVKCPNIIARTVLATSHRPAAAAYGHRV